MLDRIERVELQLSNRFIYDIALGRSDSTVYPWTPFKNNFFTNTDKTKLEKTMIKVNANK